MKVSRRAAAVTRRVIDWKSRSLTVGFVPTMGALHRGHAALIDQARKKCDRVVVSIFVNPSQFGPNEDFSRYPRTWQQDRQLCERHKTDLIFYPAASEIYPEGFRTSIEVAELSQALEGAFRPGHFRGVATVVYRLFSIVRPDKAFFGEKDFQQLSVIKRMVRDLDVPVEVVGCRTVREQDGLALSSRNRYLSPAERLRAANIIAALKLGAAASQKKGAGVKSVEQAVLRRLRADAAAKIDYVCVVDRETLRKPRKLSGRLRLLTAVRLGKTRLIDNIAFSC